MNYILLLGILNLVILSRLRLTFRDVGANKTDLFVIAGLPLLSLIFLKINFPWILLASILVLMIILTWRTEKLEKSRGFWRLTNLTLYFILIGLLCSPLFDLKVNALPGNLIELIDNVFLPHTDVTIAGVYNFQLLVFGFLLILNEMNFLLRYLLHVMQLEPLREKPDFSQEELDEKEYNTGRIIGMLERIFVFVFVLFGQYTAIGFILAAKGVARFREFENRTFAEYVLIGTFLSTLLALFVGFFVQWVIL